MYQHSFYMYTFLPNHIDSTLSRTIETTASIIPINILIFYCCYVFNSFLFDNIFDSTIFILIKKNIID